MIGSQAISQEEILVESMGLNSLSGQSFTRMQSLLMQ